MLQEPDQEGLTHLHKLSTRLKLTGLGWNHRNLLPEEVKKKKTHV